MDGTIVDYLYEPSGPTPFKCGYCKSPNTSMIQGVLAHRMTCQVFQELVDRGFQRSGKFVYRPFMKETCCPQYVFRTDVTKFRLSKQQRATIRKMHGFLAEGRSSATREDGEQTERGSKTGGETVGAHSGLTSEPGTPRTKPAKSVRPGLGVDPNKPPCKKAKLLRMERQAKKVAHEAQTTPRVTKTMEQAEASSSGSQPPVVEWQEEKIAVPHTASCTHHFSTRLVPCSLHDTVFAETYQESYQVFKKFQLGVHKDDVEECKEENFKNFLVDTPLSQEVTPEGAPCKYGSYHLQYLIDGRIYAVGILDILPKGVLCEYLYYDPAYRFIAPGVYSALYEISLTQKFYKVNPAMQYYYMGFYVQSCPKMNYKRRYASSELLCPITHHYVPLPICIPRLKETEFFRLDDNSPVVNEADDVTDDVVDGLRVLHNMTVMAYHQYRSHYGGSARDGMVKAYLQLVGQNVATKTILHIPPT